MIAEIVSVDPPIKSKRMWINSIAFGVGTINTVVELLKPFIEKFPWASVAFATLGLVNAILTYRSKKNVVSKNVLIDVK